MSYKKNTQVEVLPVVDLCKKSRRLYRTNGLLSRIRYGNRGIFYDTTFGVVGQFFLEKENA